MTIQNASPAAPLSATQRQAPSASPAETADNSAAAEPEFDTYTASAGETVELSGNRRLVGDGSIDGWVRSEFGTGFLSGIDDADVPQFLESKNDHRINLPGDQDGSVQIVTARTEGDHRSFRLDTIFGNSLHTVQANYKNGAFIADSVVETLYLIKA